MEQEGVGTWIVSMHESPDPSFRWLSSGAAVTKGHVVCRQGHDPLLIFYPMERDEALASGVVARAAADFGYPSVFSSGSPVDAWSRFFRRVLDELNAAAPVAFGGFQPLHLYVPLIESLESSGVRVHRGRGVDLLQRARRRKSAAGILMIETVGQRTEEVVHHVRELLRAADRRDGELWLGAERLTIGRLKDEVSVEIVRRGMVEDHETILSLGRDAGVPHSRGTRSHVVRSSTTLVIDIFPRDARSGYFFDLTRTFCLGDVPDHVRDAHAHVLEAQKRAQRVARQGVACASLQRMTCEYFRAAGWPTIEETPATTRGYVHGLGHGVGLEVHEVPSFSLAAGDTLEVGDVFTIEPGLYDPDAGFGVRIEDTFVIDEDGSARPLSHSDRGLEP